MDDLENLSLEDKVTLIDQLYTLYESGVIFTYTDFLKLNKIQRRVYCVVMQTMKKQQMAWDCILHGKDDLALAIMESVAPEDDVASLEKLAIQRMKMERDGK